MSQRDQGQRAVPNGADAVEPSSSGAGMPDAGQLDKIRDILFGRQAKDYDSRFVSLERSVAESTAKLRTDLVARLEALDAKLASGLKDLRKLVRAESKEREAAVEHATSQADARSGDLDKRLEKLGTDLVDASQSITSDLDTRSQQLAELVSTHRDEWKASMDTMNTDKADRAALAAMFAEFARRLEDGA